MRSWIKRGIAVAAVLVVVFVGWYEIEAHPFGHLGHRVIVTVAKGESVAGVVGHLGKEHVVGDTLAYRIYLFFHGTPTVEPGTYEFHVNEPFASVSTTLEGQPDVFRVDVNAGLTVRELEAEITSDVPPPFGTQFDQAVTSGAVASPYLRGNDEGLLGTGSYLVFPGETSQTLLGQMIQRFDRQARAAGIGPQSTLSAYQLITVASIAEKEGYYPKYFGKVARVIENRLARGMALAMTSTLLYPLHRDGGAVTAADRQLQSPYNTYLNTGLTPTPIAFPSPAALAAAAHPPEGSWLYFVTVNKAGTTLFASTFPQQTANEKLAAKNGL